MSKANLENKKYSCSEANQDVFTTEQDMGGGTKTVDEDFSFAVLLRARGLKATPQRLSLLEVLSRQHAPLALHEIHEHMEEGTANLSTLYRAVHDLQKAGLIRSVDFRHTHAHYELVTDVEHHHIICTHCGMVEEYASAFCKKVTQDAWVHSKSFASISDHSFELYGVCKQCV
jgi:Fe2+ or Zn2+ uptake regulation protein